MTALEGRHEHHDELFGAVIATSLVLVLPCSCGASFFPRRHRHDLPSSFAATIISRWPFPPSRPHSSRAMLSALLLAR